MARLFRGMLFVGLFAGTMTLAARGFAEGEAQCKLATKGDSLTAVACKEGGIKKAKQVMKQMVKTAKANGVKFDCDDCHKDDAKYEILTDDGKDKFKKLVAAQSAAK